ncbi:Putative tRNA pseudouridine synthase [Rhizopus microsporus]|nr:Putative tRNA pseudouridine synthase [Rhizopus microsporus]
MGNLWSKEQVKEEAVIEQEEKISITTIEESTVGSKRAADPDQESPKTKKTKKNKRDSRPRQPPLEHSGPREPRVPKKKVALLIGFNGTGYQGLQLNPNSKTIEGEVFEALCKANGVSKDNANDPKKVNWMRCARTDKGVHAAGNILSLKMQIPSDYDIVERTNSFLPEQIRVWGYVPVIGSFNPKTLCDSRIYEYLLPTYVFMEPIKPEITSEQLHENDLMLSTMVDGEPTTFYARRSTPELIEKRHAYRATQEQIEKFKKAVKLYEGSHNFHNYTIGKGYKDHSSMRYIKNITVSEPMYIRDTEWLSIKLHGQSFMLHQIPMAMLIARTETPVSLIQQTFGEKRINIPKAPALGLLLERPVFDVYNDKLLQKTSKEDRIKIDFDVHKDKIEAFKQEWIYSKIFDTEIQEHVFDGFLTFLDAQMGHEYDYLNPEGVIPDICIVHTKYNNKRDDD